MNLVKKLKMGDTIGFFSPSKPATVFAKKRYERAVSYLEKKGFKIIKGDLFQKADFYRSGTIQERAEELNKLIRNPKIKCIIATIGGMNSNSLLPYIDYNAFKENPKIIIGYSDITAILLSIYQKTGLTTYYGPALVASFGEFPPFVDETFKYFKMMATEETKYPVVLTPPKYWTDEYIDWESQDRSKTMNENQWEVTNLNNVRGRLIGGNLNTMEGIWGTEYMPKIKKGDILFIEDSMKNASEIERSFSLLKISNVFEKIGGLILGKHELFDAMDSNRKPIDILLEVIGEELKFPIISDFDCSHTHPMFTLPIGSYVEMDTRKKTVTILSELYDERR